MKIGKLGWIILGASIGAGTLAGYQALKKGSVAVYEIVTPYETRRIQVTHDPGCHDVWTGERRAGFDVMKEVCDQPYEVIDVYIDRGNDRQVDINTTLKTRKQFEYEVVSNMDIIDSTATSDLKDTVRLPGYDAIWHYSQNDRPASRMQEKFDELDPKKEK